ncbi:MAG: RsiW-degrading membrane proteinase PrsW (M82 family) [Rhodothermales bacterium]
MFAVHIALSLLPVLLFLAALRLMDSFKLVQIWGLLSAIGAGCLAAAAAFYVNTWIQGYFGLSDESLRRYPAPLAEELLKGILLGGLVARQRVGFLVDAAIYGFAIGTGFACVENIFYLGTRDAALLTWVVRGFGTAIMHAGTTAVLAILTKLLMDWGGEVLKPWMVFPGLLAAVVIHSAYNHFLLPPLVATALIAVTLPLLVSFVFERSEAATREWMTSGFDADQELLRLIESGGIADTRVGHYLGELQARFPGTIIVDMLCLVRLEMELSIRAKGMLMMREAGFSPKPDDAVRAKVSEVRYLEGSIGRTGLLAIDPFRRTSDRDKWQRSALGLD